MARYLLGILDDNAIKCPDELPGESAPDYYETPKAAKVAGREILGRHAGPVGFIVRRIFNVGHYRTVHVEAR